MSDIRREYTFWCAKCVDWERFSDPRLPAAKKAAKKAGWLCYKRRWYCPICAKLKPEERIPTP